jgi:ATP-dependent exoDNAse (exonuclease V) alpha subunit
VIHVDTEQAHPNLINSRMAYVSVSRGRYDAQIYTNDKTNLAQELARDVSHRSAMEYSRASAPVEQKVELSSARSQTHRRALTQGHAIER